jgi:hypothetical protein
VQAEELRDVVQVGRGGHHHRQRVDDRDAGDDDVLAARHVPHRATPERHERLDAEPQQREVRLECEADPRQRTDRDSHTDRDSQTPPRRRVGPGLGCRHDPRQRQAGEERVALTEVDAGPDHESTRDDQGQGVAPGRRLEGDAQQPAQQCHADEDEGESCDVVDAERRQTEEPRQRYDPGAEPVDEGRVVVDHVDAEHAAVQQHTAREDRPAHVVVRETRVGGALQNVEDQQRPCGEVQDGVAHAARQARCEPRPPGRRLRIRARRLVHGTGAHCTGSPSPAESRAARRRGARSRPAPPRPACVDGFDVPIDLPSGRSRQAAP